MIIGQEGTARNPSISLPIGLITWKDRSLPKAALPTITQIEGKTLVPFKKADLFQWFLLHHGFNLKGCEAKGTGNAYLPLTPMLQSVTAMLQLVKMTFFLAVFRR